MLKMPSYMELLIAKPRSRFLNFKEFSALNNTETGISHSGQTAIKLEPVLERSEGQKILHRNL